MPSASAPSAVHPSTKRRGPRPVRAVATPMWLLAVAVVAAFALQQAVQAILNAVYAASGYPVPYFVGQLSFSAERLEAWYGHMLSAGTLDVYVQAQLVDLGYIVATALAHVVAIVFVRRLFPAGPAGDAGRRTGVVAMWVAVAAPAFDALENAVSFVNLANPTDVSTPLAIVYSGFAVAKFLCFALTYTWLVVGAVWAAVLAVRARRSVGRSGAPTPRRRTAP